MRLPFYRFVVAWVAAWASWFTPGTAYAAFSNVTPPSSIGGTLGSLLMTAGSTHNWAGGKVAALASVNAGGRAVTVPFTVRALSTAGTVVANAIKANPLGLAATLAATVLLPLVYDDAVSEWKVVETGGTITEYRIAENNGISGWHLTAVAAAQAYFNAVYYNPSANCGVYGGGTVYTYIGATVNGGQVTISYTTRVPEYRAWESPPGYYCSNANNGSMVRTLQTQQGQGETSRPATEEDWDAKRALPPCFGPDGTYCWKDEVLNAPDVKAAPLPVDTPVLNPNPAGVPQPVRVPTGSPQPIPGTNPQKYRQPFVDVKPWNSPSAPWQVDVIPGVWEGTDPNGLPDPTNDPNAPAPGTGGGTTTELKTCGLPDTPPCKIDETGTKEGDATGEFAGADATRNTAADGIRDMIDNPEAPTTLGWNFTTGLFGFPAASCQPFAWGSRLGTLSVDVCNNSLVLTVRSMLAWMLWGMTLLYVWRRVNDSVENA